MPTAQGKVNRFSFLRCTLFFLLFLFLPSSLTAQNSRSSSVAVAFAGGEFQLQLQEE